MAPLLSTFNEVVAPILEAAGWVLSGITPKRAIKKGKSNRRGFKNYGFETENGMEDVDRTSDNTIISIWYSGKVIVYHTKDSSLINMKNDLYTALKGYVFRDFAIDSNPTKRNKANSQFTFAILQC